MSRSKDHLTQASHSENSEQPTSQDFADLQEDRVTSGCREGENVSLVEQILEFLDRYPACFAAPNVMPGLTP